MEDVIHEEEIPKPNYSHSPLLLISNIRENNNTFNTKEDENNISMGRLGKLVIPSQVQNR